MRERGIRVPTNPYRRRQDQNEPTAQGEEELTNAETNAEVNEEETLAPQQVESVAAGENAVEETAIAGSSSTQATTISKAQSSKEKAAAKKKRKRKADDGDSEDEFEDDGIFSAKNVAPRSGYSKLKKTDNQRDSSIVRFCSRCLRRYIPNDKEPFCHACLSIKSQRSGGVPGKKRGRKMVTTQEGERVAVLSLKELCIRVRFTFSDLYYRMESNF